MKNIRFHFVSIIAVAGILLQAAAVRAEKRLVYLSSGEGIAVFEADPATGKLTDIQKVEAPGLLALTEDRGRAYVMGKKQLWSFLVEGDGTLREAGVAEIEQGGGYVDLDATERFLAASHYGAGTAAIWPIDESGVAQGTPADEAALEQRAHSSVFSPDNRFLLVPATGPNKVFQLRFDEKTGTLEPNDPPSAPGPTGEGTAQQPRHLVFHPNGRMAYTTLERELPGVGVWNWDAESGRLDAVQNVVTLPEGFEGSITTADLHLTPDAKFLYVSNRDLTDRKATSGESSIVGFRVDPDTGRLDLIGHTPCEHIPRSFAIDEAGEYVYVAGQMAEKLGVYRIDPSSGELERVQQLDTGPKPNWVVCGTLP
ncbi:MAG: beta-propeller fold lactonase family protein [Verrucomicrobiales bacterium]